MGDVSDGEKTMLAACFICGLVIGIRHGGSIVLGFLYGIGIMPAAIFATEMLSPIVSKRAAGFLIAALAVVGAYKAGTGPVVHSGTGVCVQVDRWGNEKCD